MEKQLIFSMSDKYEQYMFDESRMTGAGESISFPESEAEALSVLSFVKRSGAAITIQGGKTGVAGGAVPEGGHVMNMSHMCHILEFKRCDNTTALLRVEPGINLLELKKEIAGLSGREKLFWPPEPTVSTATVGGIAATGARGICAYLYGDSRRYIEAVRLITADGVIKNITRCEQPELLDSLIGSEGIAGVFTEVTLRLIREPDAQWGICFFFDAENDLCSFAEAMQANKSDFICGSAAVAAVEYIDEPTLKLIDSHKGMMNRLKELPDIPENCIGTVYVELHGAEDDIEQLAERLLELSAECGCDEERTWAVSGEPGIQKLREFRYAASEIVNTCIDEAKRDAPDIVKLTTDMSFPGERFSQILTRYKADAQRFGLTCCVYGHAGENLLYANLLPTDHQGYLDGLKLIREWAVHSIKCGGKTVREYGIGKLNKKVLHGLLPADKVDECKRLSTMMDPERIWNRGNIFD
jgi:D-lactate dehydrogenase (cytochrome)